MEVTEAGTSPMQVSSWCIFLSHARVLRQFLLRLGDVISHRSGSCRVMFS